MQGYCLLYGYNMRKKYQDWKIEMYSAYIFDQDGTIYLGDDLLPGAQKTLEILRNAGKRTLFLSNNPSKTREQYSQKLTRLGIPTPVDDIINSTYVMLKWLSINASAARLYVIGEQSLIDEVRSAGFQVSEKAGEIDLVIASFDRGFHYGKLQIAFDAIRAGARLVATNPDRFCPVPGGGGEPDCAAIIAAIEACTGITCEVIFGKPSPIMIEAILDILKLPAAECMMVGDRLETDVAMGVSAGMATCLMLTGASTREDCENSTVRPSLVLEKIDGLLEY